MVGGLPEPDSGAATAEMAAAMYVPFIPLWLDLLSPPGLIIVGHVLMLAGMAALMLLRPAEYTRQHTGQTCDGSTRRSC